MFKAMLDWLKWEEKDDLFANFPIGATIQDGGKRKRSGCIKVFYCFDISLEMNFSSNVTFLAKSKEKNNKTK